ncbi:MAG: hypothetical protein MUC65_09225, partial [Pontiellaceae bacterium]|nr:hypothetical protein [Pontiellaceae bacterium]
MNTKRYLQLLFAVILVVAAVFAFQALHIPGSATKINSNYVGMGDLQRLEAAQALPKAAVIERNESYAGMGDLRRLEAEQALPKAVVIDR